jgi:4-oxalocrotonate tautomerase
MPYVNIKITREGATSDQKAQLIKGVTQLLADVLGKNPQTTVVVIDEVETENWGIGGETVTVIRSSASAAGPDEDEKPKPRGLPEKLIQFQEQRKREKMEAAMMESAGAFSPPVDKAKTKAPAKRGRKKVTDK